MAYTSKYTGEQIDALLDVVEATPPSGGGNIEYLDIKNLNDNTKITLILLSIVTRLNMVEGGALPSGVSILPIGFLAAIDGRTLQVVITELLPTAEAVAISNDSYAIGGGEVSLVYIMQTLGGINNADEVLAAIPRITKEQFYTL